MYVRSRFRYPNLEYVVVPDSLYRRRCSFDELLRTG